MSGGRPVWRQGGPLDRFTGVSDLVRRWLADTQRGATAQVGDFLTVSRAAGSVTPAAAAGGVLDEGLPSPAPAFAAAHWREAWWAELFTDLPDDAARRRGADNAARLARGEADVVITGQQPGLLGGPLYTLLKVAAAVEAAALRSAAGRLTVPLYWSGDDDDDRREAFQPLVYDPARALFLRGLAPGGPADRMVGAAPASEWGRGEVAWLREQAGRDLPGSEVAAKLAALWDEGMRENVTWGRLHRRALLRLFAGSDLLAVSGNDGRLHAVAGPFYARLWRDRVALAAAARAGGESLRALGLHAQLAEGSLARPFHLAAGERRLAIPENGSAAPPEASALRPGVMLRAAVQDWLFRPAGAVVGPAELAYLQQLDPVYIALALPRAPLLPRLFVDLEPIDANRAHRLTVAARPDLGSAPSGPEVSRLATRIADLAAAELARALQAEAGLEPARARDLARRQAVAWAKNAAELLGREVKRRSGSLAPRAIGAQRPAWAGSPERAPERTLAMLSAVAIWGEDLVAAARAAAREHFVSGARGEWRSFVLELPPE